MNRNFNDLLRDLPVDCRRAARDAMLLSVSNSEIDAATARASIKALIEAMYRTKRRRDSDHITDGFRRKLVGARVQGADYLRYQRAADAAGVSLYRWVYSALEAAAVAQEASE